MDDNTMAVAVVALIASGTVLSFFAFFVGRAWAERIRGAHRVEGGEAVKALREDMQVELQQVRHELGELAERVDFTERLLSKQREAARLGPPQCLPHFDDHETRSIHSPRPAVRWWVLLLRPLVAALADRIRTRVAGGRRGGTPRLKRSGACART
jgi:hypothetical protein